MQHLDVERLAALSDEVATDEERMHLMACSACRHERDAFVALAGLATDAGKAPTGSNAPRLTDWNSLSTRLRAEGLITGEPVTAEYPVPVVVRSISGGSIQKEPMVDAIRSERAQPSVKRAPSTHWWSLLPRPYLQIAAALTLVLGGLAGGRMTAGVSVLPRSTNPNVNTAGTTFGFGNEDFSSVAQATYALSRAQSEYERASLWLANHDTTVTPAMYRQRLAALDLMMSATREALHEAPQDPVLNTYYESAVKAREATLQQLSGVLPVNKIIERF